MSNDTLRRGDLVEVKSPGEVLATLDERGALEDLPFMPEMAALCDRRFVVDGRAGLTPLDEEVALWGVCVPTGDDTFRARCTITARGKLAVEGRAELVSFESFYERGSAKE